MTAAAFDCRGKWATWNLSFIDPGNADGGVIIPGSPPVKLEPITYACPRCDAGFNSPQARRDCPFVEHPYRRASLLLHGKDLSDTVTVINESTRDADWLLVSCESVSRNGVTIEPAALFNQLTEFRQGFHVLELISQDTRERFELSLCIPEHEELQRLEDIFRMLSSDNELSVDDIRRFAEAWPRMRRK